MKKVLNYHQSEDTSDADYLAGFNAKVDVLESHGAEIVVGDSLLKLNEDYKELDWNNQSLTVDDINSIMKNIRNGLKKLETNI